MILWCWYSWRRRDSCDADDRIVVIPHQVNTRPRLNIKSQKTRVLRRILLLQVLYQNVLLSINIFKPNYAVQ